MRNLIVSASVLTGQIWVQDASTGAIIKRMGTVYPMYCEIALSWSCVSGYLQHGMRFISSSIQSRQLKITPN